MSKTIVLLGYMGSGKSSVGKLISKEALMEFTDLDDYIEKREGLVISEIFKKKGEIHFRKREQFYLKQLMDPDKELILSVGGGTPCYSDNMDIINKKAISIYLRSSVESLYNRLSKEKTIRPLIEHIPDDNLKIFIRNHLSERTPFYERAQITIFTDNKTPEEITRELLNLI